MFERTLQDLIRGLRAHKASSKAQEDAFLAEVMAEIRDELRGKDMALKAEGIIKMCYLMMLYPIPAPPSFAFHVVEVMSSPRYHLKQLGYLAAPMAFTGDTEEVVLTVNGLKKDLLSPHISLPPLPLTALPHLLASSPSLSNTLHPDLLHLLTHSSPRIRKRAVLCLLPCWEAFPEGLREGFPRLRDKLQDEDQGVVGAAVGVVMELARRQGGQNYLPLAPELFGILTGSSNNWMLIKVVKLFAILTPLEPRLVRKLLPPITNLISSTSAISLLYECVRTCIVGGMLDPDRPESDALARVCVEKLGGYLRDEGGDQNLRYIALLAMVKIVPTHPHMVAEYQEEILESLDDSDVSIRMRALELVSSMVDSENLQSIADQFLSHLSPPDPSALPSAVASLQALSDPSASIKNTSAAVSLSPGYRRVLTQKLLGIVQHDTYSNVTDFEWVINLLVDVAYVSKVNEGVWIRDMIMDIVGRVRDVRAHAVRVLEKVLGDAELRGRVGGAGVGEAEMGLMLAAVWVCGEYSSYLTSPLSAIASLTPSGIEHSFPILISLSLQAVTKVVGTYCADVSATDRWNTETHTQAKDLIASCRTGIAPLLQHSDLDVQGRASELDALLQFVAADLNAHKAPARVIAPIAMDKIPGVEGGFETDPTPSAPGQNGKDDEAPPAYPKSLFLLQPLFSAHELNAVSENAQAAVRIPDGLDLDRDLVPGGGWTGNEADLVESSAEEQEATADALGQGGGAGMDELRRVIREGQKKGKRREGETPGEKRERQARRRARKERQKGDPYYLGGDNDSDVDEIPIVVLDDTGLGAPPISDPAGPSDTRAKKRTVKLSTGKKVKPGQAGETGKEKPMQFDRLGEMPDSSPASGSTTSLVDSRPTLGVATAGKTDMNGTNGKAGLAGVDLSEQGDKKARARPAGRDQYVYDGADAEPEASSAASPAPDTTTGGEEMPHPDDQAAAGGDIEVVKVKRKKKKKPVV